MKLYGYFRSSCSYRVRIGLGLKSLAYEPIAVSLVKDGGEQLSADHRARNPMAQVPVLEIEDTPGDVIRLSQSVAILEYLEERFPSPALMPKSARVRARVRTCVELVNSGIQPFQNLSTMNEIKRLGGDSAAYAREANERGLAALETEAVSCSGKYLVGDEITLADVLLVPQLYSARRLKADVTRFPRLAAIDARLAEHEAFARAHPDRQADAQP